MIPTDADYGGRPWAGGQNALAQLGGAPMQRRTARLTAQGYTGPMPGTPELMAARQAGQHPIWDWRMAQHPGFAAGGHGFAPGGGYGLPMPGGHFGSYQNPTAPRPMYPGGMPGYGGGPQMPQGVAYGEPNGLAMLDGSRRPPKLAPR